MLTLSAAVACKNVAQDVLLFRFRRFFLKILLNQSKYFDSISIQYQGMNDGSGERATNARYHLTELLLGGPSFLHAKAHVPVPEFTQNSRTSQISDASRPLPDLDKLVGVCLFFGHMSRPLEAICFGCAPLHSWRRLMAGQTRHKSTPKNSLEECAAIVNDPQFASI